MADDTDYYPTYPLNFVTGDYVYREIQIEDEDPDSADPENPDYIVRDLTGWTGTAQIRKDTKRETPIIASLVVSNFDSTGLIKIELLEDESKKVDIKGGWDLQLRDPDGKPETVLGGPVKPRLDYTR